jgi:hypothetical protein
MHHTDYIEAKMKEFKIRRDDKALSPMKPNSDKSLDEEPRAMDSERDYKGLLGSLLYTYQVVHGELAYAVTRFARFGHAWGFQHWNGLTRLMQYAFNVKDRGLRFTAAGLTIDAYVDASFNTPRSVTGYVVRIGGTAVIWRSKLQGLSTQSTMEAEYVALSEVVKEILFVIHLFLEFKIQVDYPIKIWEDNDACIQLAKDPVFRDRAKHIEVRYHLVRDLVEDSTVSVEYVETSKQMANGFTKPVDHTSMEEMMIAMNLCAWNKGNVSS